MYCNRCWGGTGKATKQHFTDLTGFRGWGVPQGSDTSVESEEEEFRGGVFGEERRQAWLDLNNEGKKGVQARPWRPCEGHYLFSKMEAITRCGKGI